MNSKISVSITAVALAVTALSVSAQSAAQASCAPLSTRAQCCSNSGPWKLLDGDVRIDDFDEFAAFVADNGFPVHPTGGEIIPQRTMYLGVPSRGGVDQSVIQQYIAFKYPRVRYCEVFIRPRLPFCPPQGGVLFIQPAPINPGDPIPPGGAYLRSESDENCSAPACPACRDKPGACWGSEFSDQTIEEIWIR